MFKEVIGVIASNNFLGILKGNRTCGPKIKTQQRQFPWWRSKAALPLPSILQIILSCRWEQKWLLLLLSERCWCTVEMVSLSLEVKRSFIVHSDRLAQMLKHARACLCPLFSRAGQNSKKYLQKVLPKPTSKQLNGEFIIILTIIIINAAMNVQWIFCKYPISTCTRRKVAEN